MTVADSQTLPTCLSLGVSRTHIHSLEYTSARTHLTNVLTQSQSHAPPLSPTYSHIRYTLHALLQTCSHAHSHHPHTPPGPSPQNQALSVQKPRTQVLGKHGLVSGTGGLDGEGTFLPSPGSMVGDSGMEEKQGALHGPPWHPSACLGDLNCVPHTNTWDS